MTVFSDDANLRLKLRAFRLVTAALNAPMAQPTWPDALLDRLTPPLPLVDCDPLSTWGQTSTAEAAAAPGPSPAPRSRPGGQASQAVERGTPAESSAPGQNAVTRAAASLSWLSHEDDPVSSAAQRDRRSPDRTSRSIAPQPSNPTVPGRSPMDTVAPGFKATPLPLVGPNQPDFWPTPQSQAAPPLTALAEIGRLTGEILAGSTAPESLRGSKNWAANASVSPVRSRQPFPEPLTPKPQPQAESLPPVLTTPSSALPLSPLPPPSPRLNLASLAALYAEASPSPAAAPPFTPAEHRDWAPLTARVNTASTAFATPALGDVSPLEAALPGLAGDNPGPSELEVAETLTAMVSAILQAQAQRHGVDLSWE